MPHWLASLKFAIRALPEKGDLLMRVSTPACKLKVTNFKVEPGRIVGLVGDVFIASWVVTLTKQVNVPHSYD